jgi:hypothetical protein
LPIELIFNELICILKYIFIHQNIMIKFFRFIINPAGFFLSILYTLQWALVAQLLLSLFFLFLFEITIKKLLFRQICFHFIFIISLFLFLFIHLL